MNAEHITMIRRTCGYKFHKSFFRRSARGMCFVSGHTFFNLDSVDYRYRHGWGCILLVCSDWCVSCRFRSSRGGVRSLGTG